MAIFPLNLIFNLLSTFFSIGIIVLQVYCFRKWHEGAQYADLYLISGLFSLLITFFGRSIVLAFFEKATEDEPNDLRGSKPEYLESSDTTKLYTEYFGPENAKETIIFLHGSGVDSTEWYYLKKELQNNYKLILYDLSGAGLSQKPKNNDYSLEKHARDLDKLVKICPKPPILIGHSMGTMIILTYYRMYLEDIKTKIKAIVLCNSTYTNPIKTAIFAPLLQSLEKVLIVPLAYLQIILAPIFQLSNYLNYINGTLHLSVAYTGFAGTQTRQQLDFAAKYGTTNSVKTVAENILYMRKYDATDILSKIELPTKIITSSIDRMTKSSAGEWMSKQIPNSDLSEIQNAGHMGLFEQHNSFVKEIKNFIKKLK